LKLQKEARSRKVTLYRAYREGEIPDIQISSKDLILPLQILATRDIEFSGQIYHLLVSEIVNAMSNSTPLTKLEKGLSSSIQHSSQYFTPFIGSMLRILYNCPSICKSIGLEFIAKSAISSLNFSLGAILLEQRVYNTDDTNERSNKRTKVTISQSTENIQLPFNQIAKIYNQLGRLEIYKAILAEHLSSSKVTKEAQSAELSNNYRHVR
jgi:DNA-dependent protein kinase catalytic subunit